MCADPNSFLGILANGVDETVGQALVFADDVKEAMPYLNEATAFVAGPGIAFAVLECKMDGVAGQAVAGGETMEGAINQNVNKAEVTSAGPETAFCVAVEES